MTEQELIARYVAERGVTRCPTACVAPTQARLSAADVEAHRARGLDPFGDIYRAENRWQRLVRLSKIARLKAGASRDSKGVDFEYRLPVPDGSIKHVRVTAHPSRDSLGNLEFVGAVTDVSEQRQAEAVIRHG